MVFEAERLRLRKINQNNFDDLCDILRDETYMLMNMLSVIPKFRNGLIDNLSDTKKMILVYWRLWNRFSLFSLD